MNKFNVTGNVGQEPTYATVGNGAEVFKFSIADNQSDGTTQWYNVSLFDPNKKFTDTIKKGSLLDVIGTLKIREYTNKDGQTKTAFDVTAFSRGINYVGAKRDDAVPAGDVNLDDIPF